jgi:hypothetical protein
MESYDIPDEHLSYSELKDRIKEECARNLPAKDRIILLAKKLEQDLQPKETICEQICKDLEDVTAERWIRKCLPEEYKQVKKRNKGTEQLSGSRSAYDDKNSPERETVTVDAQGHEVPFDETKRKDVEQASEIVKKLQKKVAEVTNERDNLSNEVQVLKEKTQPELLHDLHEMFYDKPGLMYAKQLQKINEKAGRNLETIVQRYNAIIKDVVESGEPVPLGVYVVTKPDMKLVPVRIFIDFDRRSIKLSLWEMKLQSLNN